VPIFQILLFWAKTPLFLRQQLTIPFSGFLPAPEAGRHVPACRTGKHKKKPGVGPAFLLFKI
jgi:hypothetical protein